MQAIHFKYKEAITFEYKGRTVDVRYDGPYSYSLYINGQYEDSRWYMYDCHREARDIIDAQEKEYGMKGSLQK